MFKEFARPVHQVERVRTAPQIQYVDRSFLDRPTPWNDLVKKWRANPRWMDMFRRTTYDERIRHHCDSHCTFVCDHERDWYLCTRTGCIHMCSSEHCERKETHSNRQIICPISGRVFEYDTSDQDMEYASFSGNIQSDRKAVAQYIQHQRGGSTAFGPELSPLRSDKEEIEDERLGRIRTAESLVQQLLFSPTREELRRQARFDIQQQALIRAEGYWRKCRSIRAMPIDLGWLVASVTSAPLQQLMERRALWQAPKDLKFRQRMIQRIASTAAHLWSVFEKRFPHILEQRKYKYDLHTHAVLFCMIKGIPDRNDHHPPLLESLYGLEFIAPSKFDLQKFGYSREKYSKGETLFRQLLVQCRPS